MYTKVVKQQIIKNLQNIIHIVIQKPAKIDAGHPMIHIISATVMPIVNKLGIAALTSKIIVQLIDVWVDVSKLLILIINATAITTAYNEMIVVKILQLFVQINLVRIGKKHALKNMTSSL